MNQHPADPAPEPPDRDGEAARTDVRPPTNHLRNRRLECALRQEPRPLCREPRGPPDGYRRPKPRSHAKPRQRGRDPLGCGQGRKHARRSDLGNPDSPDRSRNERVAIGATLGARDQPGAFFDEELAEPAERRLLLEGAAPQKLFDLSRTHGRSDDKRIEPGSDGRGRPPGIVGGALQKTDARITAASKRTLETELENRARERNTDPGALQELLGPGAAPRDHEAAAQAAGTPNGNLRHAENRGLLEHRRAANAIECGHTDTGHDTDRLPTFRRNRVDPPSFGRVDEPAARGAVRLRGSVHERTEKPGPEKPAMPRPPGLSRGGKLRVRPAQLEVRPRELRGVRLERRGRRAINRVNAREVRDRTLASDHSEHDRIGIGAKIGGEAFRTLEKPLGKARHGSRRRLAGNQRAVADGDGPDRRPAARHRRLAAVFEVLGCSGRSRCHTASQTEDGHPHRRPARTTKPGRTRGG